MLEKKEFDKIKEILEKEGIVYLISASGDIIHFMSDAELYAFINKDEELFNEINKGVYLTWILSGLIHRKLFDIEGDILVSAFGKNLSYQVDYEIAKYIMIKRSGKKTSLIVTIPEYEFIIEYEICDRIADIITEVNNEVSSDLPELKLPEDDEKEFKSIKSRVEKYSIYKAELLNAFKKCDELFGNNVAESIQMEISVGDEEVVKYLSSNLKLTPSLIEPRADELLATPPKTKLTGKGFYIFEFSRPEVKQSITPNLDFDDLFSTLFGN